MARRRKQFVTIVDVARSLGVAPSTVSNALNGKRVVAPQTRNRILAKCEEMNYRASSVARALRTHRTFAVGVLLPDISNPVFSEIVKGIDQGLAPAGYTTLLANSSGDPAREAAAVRAFANRDVDGLILVSQHVDVEEVAEALFDLPPTVIIHRRGTRIRADYVGADNRGGTGTAIDHVAALGHRRVAFITGPADSSAAVERLDGYYLGVQRNRLKPAPELVAPGDYSLITGYRAARDLLSVPDRPTALVAANDIMAFAAMDVALQMGLRVPDDISIVGFDDIFLAALPGISLTSVHQPAAEIGEAAAQCLLRRLQHEEAEPVEVILPTRLVLRHSTASLPRVVRPGESMSSKGLDRYLGDRWRPGREWAE